MGASKPRSGMAFLALVLAVVVLIILAITFRGLWFVALPLALIALVFAVLSGAGERRGLFLVTGYLALMLALIATTGSLLGTIAAISIDRGYNLYERK